MDESAPKPRPAVGQLSKTPSWVMLGFLLGAAFVLALPRRETPPRPVVASPAPETPTRPTHVPLLTTIEAVFDDWSSYAVWSNDVTQVALWNSEVGDFAEFYEVRRVDRTFYFRSLPELTNRIIRHGKQPPPECPLRFTETLDQYREWREQGRFERPPETRRPVLTVPRAEPEAPRPSVDVPNAKPPPSSAVDTVPPPNR